MNSASADPERLDPTMQLAAKYGAGVIALTMGVDGIPTTSDGRVGIAMESLLPAAEAAGLPVEDIYLDPLVLTVTCNQDVAQASVEAIRMFKMVSDPAPTTTVGLSNISNGCPPETRPLINRTFLVMLMAAGLDTAIADPHDAAADGLDPHHRAAATTRPPSAASCSPSTTRRRSWATSTRISSTATIPTRWRSSRPTACCIIGSCTQTRTCGSESKGSYCHMSTRNLENLFNPKSIAVIGASNTPGSVGYILTRNLIGAQYQGVVYPVNPKARAIQGILAYPNIGAVPDKVDLAIIAVPAKFVLDVVRECGEAGVASSVIVTAGFKETGAGGKDLEERVVATAKSYGLRIVGPNCLGYVRPSCSVNATFAETVPEAGRVAFISQSGALGTAVLDWASANKVGFSAFVSVGSMCDVDFGDLIDYFGADPDTSSIIIYIEALSDARKFMSAARHFAKTKPIIVVKSGRTARSAMAAASHTGAIAGDDTLYSAAFRRAGAVRVDEIEDLFDASEALSRVSSPRGPKLGIVTNAGGPGVMASDRLLALGGELADLAPETVARLKECLPGFAAFGNPVDVGGDAPAERYAAAAAAMMDDPNCDGVMAILTPQAMSYPTETADSLIEVAQQHPEKPMLTSFMGEIKVAEGIRHLRAAHVPTFGTPEDAVRAYLYMYQHNKSLATIYETPDDILGAFNPDRETVEKIFAEVAADGRTTLSEIEAKNVLEAYEIPTVKTVHAATAEECAAKAEEIGFPVAIKILSHDITHKSDVGGIALNIRSGAEAAKQFEAIMERVTKAKPDAKILGVAVQAMSKGGIEVIIGAKKDRTFGPAIMFGMGGTGVELFRDVAVDFPPLNQALASTLIGETKVSKLLRGWRGSTPVDMEALEQTLVKASYLLVDFPEITRDGRQPAAGAPRRAGGARRARHDRARARPARPART